MTAATAEPAGRADGRVAAPEAAGLPLPPKPGFGATVALGVRHRRNPWFITTALARAYGDVIRLPVPFMDIVLLSHPDDITRVNLGHRSRYARSRMVTDSMRVQGSAHHASWFEDDDAEWARGRDLLQPHFTQKALGELGGLFTGAITDSVAGWIEHADASGHVELHERCKELALDVLYNAMFSTRLTRDELHSLLHALDERMVATTWRTLLFALPGRVPRPAQRRGTDADLRLDEHLAELIAHRRANPIETIDLLSVLLDSRYADGSPLPDHKIRTEMLFLVIGGHETTAAGLAWALALLATHPAAMQRATSEVDALGGRAVSPAEMADLTFLRACFDEALRLQGGLVFNPKVALVDDALGGYRVPAGATVLHSNITLGRDPRFWGAEPDTFRPERWLSDPAPPAASYQTFGRGPRMCMGKRFAYIEAVLTLATALQRYRLHAPPGWRPRHHYQMSMGVRGGVPLRIEPRGDA